jgi:type II secretory pathway pseudopilin PulG
LVELLVVIGVIAILIAMLLPTLNKARNAAARAVCASNQQQVLQAIHMYGSQFKGTLPSPIFRANASYSNFVYSKVYEAATTPTDRRWTIEGWGSLGLLHQKRMLKDSRVFYCPSVQSPWYLVYRGQWPLSPLNIQPGEVEHGRDIYTGYSYRIWHNGAVGILTDAVVKRLLAMKLGRRGMASNALISDNMSRHVGAVDQWGHVKPYGLVVGYSDGHVEYIQVPEKVYTLQMTLKSGDPYEQDVFHYLMFEAFDTKNFTAVFKHFKII